MTYNRTGGAGAIPLTQGRVALVDEQDLQPLGAFKWQFHNEGYAARSVGRGPLKHNVFMHRVVLAAEPGQQVDHIDGDGLNNRRCNLRLCTHAENTRNRRKTGGSSRFKGVRRVTGHDWRGGWRAEIRDSGKMCHLGTYQSEEQAARAYDTAAREKHGAFARLNFPGVGEQSA